MIHCKITSNITKNLLYVVSGGQNFHAFVSNLNSEMIGLIQHILSNINIIIIIIIIIIMNSPCIYNFPEAAHCGLPEGDSEDVIMQNCESSPSLIFDDSSSCENSSCTSSTKTLTAASHSTSVCGSEDRNISDSELDSEDETFLAQQARKRRAYEVHTWSEGMELPKR
jgi:hypothetical protein